MLSNCLPHLILFHTQFCDYTVLSRSITMTCQDEVSVTSDLQPTGAVLPRPSQYLPPTEFGELHPPGYREEDLGECQKQSPVGSCSRPASPGNHGNHGNYRPVSRMLWHRKFISSITLTLVGYSCFHPRYVIIQLS